MPNRIKLETIQKIKLLRSYGQSLPEISRNLKVSRTSVLRHIRNVQILPEYLSEWVGKRGGSRKRKIIKEQNAYNEAKELVMALSRKEKMLILSALYWAEGNKKDLILTNSDPRLVSVFMNIAREVLDIKESRFQVSLRIYEDIDEKACLLFWSEVTQIPKDNFLATHILPGKKSGKLKFGMCRVRVKKGSDELKKIFSINKIVSELILESVVNKQILAP